MSAKLLINVVNELKLDLNLCIGQGYDGASNMSSERVGVAAEFKKEAPNADFQHCMMHQMNLSAGSAIKDVFVNKAHAIIKNITKFFNHSAKRVEHLKTIIRKAEDIRISKNKLTSLCTTRFLERHKAVQVLRNLLPYIYDALTDMTSWSSRDTRSGAYTLQEAIDKCNFLVSIVMLENITGLLLPLTTMIQDKQIDMSGCMEQTKLVIIQLKEMKEVSHWNRMYQEVKLLGQRMDVEIKVPGKRTRIAINQHTKTTDPEEHYHAVWKGAVGNVIEDMNARFGEEKKNVAALEQLIPAKAPKPNQSQELTDVLLDHFDDFLDTSPMLLEREINRWLLRWEPVYRPNQPATALSALNQAKQYPSVAYLLKYLATLPVSTAEPERTFSKVERTKTAIRATMTVGRLENLILIMSHREIFPTVEEIAERFIKTSARRLVF